MSPSTLCSNLSETTVHYPGHFTDPRPALELDILCLNPVNDRRAEAHALQAVHSLNDPDDG